jgi:hypothetical protein
MNSESENINIETPSDELTEEYKAVKSDFNDFNRFLDNASNNRAESKRRFIADIDYVPSYNYPKLASFKDDDQTVQKKTDVYNAVLELEVSRKAAEIIGDSARAAELMLYRSFHDLRLKKIMLTDAAQHLHDTARSADQETARYSFMLLNKEIFGEVNEDWFNGMLAKELKKAKVFQPTDLLGAEISGALSGTLANFENSEATEPEILSDTDMSTLHEYVLQRYQHVLAEVPDTDDDRYYDATECAEIINNTLVASGLGDDGWSSEVNSSKLNPVTNIANRKIYLPTSTRRNANELRRLIVHEQEGHARRAQNGIDKKSKILQSGTADYADVEEGLGVILECAVAGDLSNPSFNRARERYITAGLALGVDNGAPRDAREVYEILWRMIAIDSSVDGSMSEKMVDKAKDKAFGHVENAFRGTDFWMKGTVYLKLKVYYEGLVKNAQYLSENIDNLDTAFDDAMIGKINHTDPEELSQVKMLFSEAQ